MPPNDPSFRTLPPGDESTPPPLPPTSATEPGTSATVGASSSADATPANIRPLGSPLPPQFGRYRIVKQLGRGGMGTVYLAQDTQLGDRPVALKVPLVHPDEQSAYWERFHREARAAAALHHPNICSVYDVGSIDGILFLAMAFIEGQPLNQRIRAGPPPPTGEAARLTRALALALAEAHEHGVVHRDLKPGNVIINQRGEPVIMDFGLAWIDKGDASRLTQTGDVLGTPAYMPPEQVTGDTKLMGPRSDIYSLGVILFELLTGQVPFTGSSGMVLAKVLTEAPPPPSSLRPGLDPGLEAICMKAMAKRPAERFASMREFARALEPYLGAVAAEPSATLVQLVTPHPRPRSRRWLAMAVLLLGLAGLAGLAWYYQPLLQQWTARPGATQGLVADTSPRTEPVAKPLPGLVWTRKSAGERVNSLAFSPDGRRLLSGSGNKAKVGAIQLWDVATGKELTRLDRLAGKWVPLQGAQRVAFAPGGTKAISIGDLTTIWLWDVHGKEAPVRIVDGGKQIQDAVFLPDGKSLLYTENPSDKAECRLKLTALLEPDRAGGYLEGTARPCFSIAVSADGRLAVSGSNDGAVTLWDLQTRKPIRQLDAGPAMARRVAFTADGRRILLGSGLNILMIWDAASGERLSVQSLPDLARGRANFAFAADGRRAVIGRSPPPGDPGEHVVLVWDLDAQKPLQRFVCDTEIGCVEISADGQFVTAGCDDTTIRLWRLEP